MNSELLTPSAWSDYELIDSGGFEKLERFGRYVVARPEPQALWNKSLSEEEWHSRADAYFSKERGNEERGEWICSPAMPQQWWVEYRYRDMVFRMRLGLTSFKHVGIFPEQGANWMFIYDRVREIAERTGERPRVLNLFAYTGGATLAALAAGAEVTHVDSVKQVVSWARENMEASGLDGVRWMVDDAMKFVRREVKRGKKYNAIILDPPAYGRGPEGEKWVLEDNLNELLTICGQLLEERDNMLLLNLYSMGMSPIIARTAVRDLLRRRDRDREPDSDSGSGSGSGLGLGSGSGHGFDNEHFGELYFNDSFGKALPLGVFYRCWR